MTAPETPHRFELELTVPGTPAQVWHAIASAEGISAWMTPTELEPVEGGALAFHMGPGETSRGRVTAFEPERRLAYEEDWATLAGRPGADVTPLVTEFLVEARSGGTCVVRVVTSAFGTGAAWEDEFWEDLTQGWAPVLDNLRLYLVHFPGQQATSMWAATSFDVGPVAAIRAVRQALGAETVGAGVRALGLTGRLERSVGRHLLVRLEGPMPGFLSCFSFGPDDGAGLHLQAFLFSDDAPEYVALQQARWQAWLEGVAAGEHPRGAPT